MHPNSRPILSCLTRGGRTRAAYAAPPALDSNHHSRLSCCVVPCTSGLTTSARLVPSPTNTRPLSITLRGPALSLQRTRRPRLTPVACQHHHLSGLPIKRKFPHCAVSENLTPLLYSLVDRWPVSRTPPPLHSAPPPDPPATNPPPTLRRTLHQPPRLLLSFPAHTSDPSCTTALPPGTPFSHPGRRTGRPPPRTSRWSLPSAPSPRSPRAPRRQWRPTTPTPYVEDSRAPASSASSPSPTS